MAERFFTSGYVFNPSATPPTVDLSSIPGASLGAIKSIIDITTDQFLYVPALAGFGSAGYAGNVLSLHASTSGCASTDQLQITLNDGAELGLDSSLQSILAKLDASIAVTGTVGVTGVAQDSSVVALNTAFGAQGTAAASSDSAAAPFVGLFRRSLAYLATLAAAVVGGKFLTAPQNNVASVSATGSVAALNSNVALFVDGMNTATIQILGTWTGALTFQGSPDGGTTYYNIGAVPYGGGAAATGASANGLWELAVGGLTHVQVVAAAALTSGSATVNLRATNGLKSVRVGNPSTNPLTTQSAATAFTDRSGTTSGTANTFTTPIAANAARQFLRITNTASDGSTLYVYDKAGGTASPSNALPLSPAHCVIYDAKVPSNAIQIAASAASVSFEASEG